MRSLLILILIGFHISLWFVVVYNLATALLTFNFLKLFLWIFGAGLYYLIGKIVGIVIENLLKKQNK